MHMFHSIAAALVLLAAPVSAQRTLTPAQMEEDLFQMSDELMTQHAGLTRYTPMEEIDEAFGAALFAVSEPRTDAVDATTVPDTLLDFVWTMFITVQSMCRMCRCVHSCEFIVSTT